MHNKTVTTRKTDDNNNTGSRSFEMIKENSVLKVISKIKYLNHTRMTAYSSVGTSVFSLADLRQNFQTPSKTYHTISNM